MARRAIAGLLWLCLLACGQTAAQTAAARVISLAPHATEMAFAAGMGEQLIAVSAWSDYPPQAQALEQVASWQGINLERIIALKPDLILAWREGNPQRPLEQLSAFGIPVMYLDPNKLAMIPHTLELLERYSQHPEVARENAAALRQRLDALQRRYARQTPVPIFLQFSSQPLFTSGGQTLQNQVLSLCGGRNIFADSAVPWPQVSREQVLRRQPQAIIVSGDDSAAANARKFWAPQLDVPVIAVAEDWFNRSGPRLLLAAERICRQLAQRAETGAAAE